MSVNQRAGQRADRASLRVTPLGIGWVHPSWRDLVIAELQDDPRTRQRFLESCGLYGVMLALSVEGEDHELAQLFLTLRDFRAAEISPAQGRGARSLATFALRRAARRFDDERRVLPSMLLDHWYALREWCAQSLAPPSVDRTWAELCPRATLAVAIDRGDLARLDEWLSLVQTLRTYDPGRLGELGFLPREEEMLTQLVADLRRHATPETPPIVEGLLRRIQDLAFGPVSIAARLALDAAAARAGD